MKNQHPVDALFKELEDRGVREEMLDGELIYDDVAHNWEFMKGLAKEQYGRFMAYKHMRLKDIHEKFGDGPEHYEQLLNDLSHEVYREDFTRSRKVNWGPVWGVLLGKAIADYAITSRGFVKTPIEGGLLLLSYPLTVPAYWVGYKAYKYFKGRRQRHGRPYVTNAFKMFGEKTGSAFQAIFNSYRDVLENK